MRLLSFLTEIENALRAETAATNDAFAWEIHRMVNFHKGMARMVLSADQDVADSAVKPRGSLFLQSFAVADGSFCLKTSLQWEGCEIAPVLAVYARPALDWKSAATRIATAWLAGPPAEVHSLAPSQEMAPLMVATG